MIFYNFLCSVYRMCFLFALVIYRMYSLSALPSETEHQHRAAVAHQTSPPSAISEGDKIAHNNVLVLRRHALIELSRMPLRDDSRMLPRTVLPPPTHTHSPPQPLPARTHTHTHTYTHTQDPSPPDFVTTPHKIAHERGGICPLWGWRLEE